MANAITVLFAEGILKETLLRIWEQGRGRKLARLTQLQLAVFELEGAPQRKAARNACGQITLTVTFNQGVALAGNEPENLTEKLTRLGAGTIQIHATAEGEA